jgi:indolepyruvate ferredoxin oxidoreductase beta subunit
MQIMEFNIIISGTGGQGTVLASRLIASAAIKNGYFARTSETIGMAQRGGCVTSHVRLSDTAENNFSPILAQKSADMLIAMEIAEAVRVLPLLKPGGIVIACDHAVFPITGAYDKDEITAYLQQIAPDACITPCVDFIDRHSAKALNVFLLAAAAESGKLPFTPDDLEEAVRENIPKKFLEVNLTAFTAGKEAYCGKL